MSGNAKPGAWPDGLVIVDKPGGMTSHDVVARIRRLARTRRVGHAGTLDPMATGVLVIGIEKATRLLGHLALTEKTYEATIRLGQSTTTDDAEGEPLPAPGSSHQEPPEETTSLAAREAAGDAPATRACDVPRPSLEDEIAKLTGEILQVPSSVSAIKVNGQRAYKLTRAGEAPELAARPVTIYEFRVTAIRQEGDFLDVDATVRCSSGTYIRALARDLGAALGTGGHLTALRRTAVGPYTLAQARTLKELEDENHRQPAAPQPHRAQVPPDPRPAPETVPGITATSGEPPVAPPGASPVTPLADAAAAAFPRVDLTEDEARRLAQGARLPMRGTRPAGSLPMASGPLGSVAASGVSAEAGDTGEPVKEGQPIAAFAPDGTLVALVTPSGGQLRSLAVFADANTASP
jgi:tRNA pseudouridine55 synthase